MHSSPSFLINTFLISFFSCCSFDETHYMIFLHGFRQRKMLCILSFLHKINCRWFIYSIGLVKSAEKQISHSNLNICGSGKWLWLYIFHLVFTFQSTFKIVHIILYYWNALWAVAIWMIENLWEIWNGCNLLTSSWNFHSSTLARFNCHDCFYQC